MVNKIEKKNAVDNVNKTKIWLFKKINKYEKPLARLTKKKK